MSKLNNDTKGWGFVRVPGGAPQLAKSETDLMHKYECIYLDNKTNEKALYLTFDNGYENGFTPKILDVLKKQRVPVTFFITGSYHNNQKALVRRMLDEGHIVGNHSLTHPSMPSLTDREAFQKEIMDLHDNFHDEYGVKMKYFRPPMGEYSERSLAMTRELGYTSVFWSLAYRDWETDNQKGADHAYAQVMDHLHDGCVILLHSVSKDNADALERIIKDARAKGYVFKSLDEYVY
ncbi:MAG: delta-lactam-biosynthetic de-N-acetylase [Christensenellales bacterium]